jgi:hypothetical protein
LGLNDRRAAPPPPPRGAAPPHPAGWGKPPQSPACNAGAQLQCHGSDVSVGTDTPLLAPVTDISKPVRHRTEYGDNQIFVKIPSRFCLIWWGVIPPVEANGSNGVDWQVLTTAKS